MRIFFVTLLISFCICKTNAQTITEKEIIGKWKVKIVEEMTKTTSKAETAKMDSVKKAFAKAIFTFEKDKKFTLDISIPELKVKAAFWQFLKNEEGIRISEKINASFENAMFQIDIKKEKKKIYFLIEEIPFLFLAEKI